MTELEKLQTRQRELAEQLTALHEEIGEAEPTAEQQTRWETLDGEHRDLSEQRIPAEEARARVAASRARWGSTQFGSRVTPFDGADVRRLNIGEARDRALKVLDDDGRGGNAAHLDDEQRTRVERLVRTRTGNLDGDKVSRMILLSETEHYRTAFQKYLARGAGAYLTADEGRAVQEFDEYRTAMSLTANAGGYGVPALIDPTIILTGQGHPNDFFAISRVEQITNDEWAGVTSAGATWYWTTEGVASTDGAPVLAGPTVPAKKITGWIPFSVEIEGDYPGFASEMSKVLNAGYTEKVVEALTNGLGTTAQPTGIVTAIEATAASQVLVSTDGSLYAADVYRLWKALPIRYRRMASWMSSTGVENAIRQFGTEDPNFTVNLLAGGIPTLFGRPYYENDYMDDVQTVSTSDSSLLLVGDFSHFLIAQRVGMTVELVPHIQSSGVPTGQRGLWAWARLGSDSINDNAFRLLTND
jgi:HK97 family phage major capsid protein